MHAGHDLFDYIIINSRPVGGMAAARYALQGSRPMVVDTPLRWAGRAKIVECDLAIECDGRKIRHAADPLARVIRDLITAGRR